MRTVKPGQFVIGPYATFDNTCLNCQYGYQSSYMHREFITRAQAAVLVPHNSIINTDWITRCTSLPAGYVER